MEALLRLGTVEFGRPGDESTPRVMTYGGTETQMIYLHGVDMPEFAAFVIPLERPEQQALFEQHVYEPIAQLAIEKDCVLMMDAPTYRASPVWIEKLGKDASAEGVLAINKAAVEAQKKIQERFTEMGLKSVLSGEIGPRGDLAALKSLGVEVVCGWTITHGNEGAGIALAAGRVGMPCMVSCTVETNGLLSDGSTIGAYIEGIDAVCAEKNVTRPLCYLVNCAHPSHYLSVLDEAQESGAEWLKRLGGIRPNASTKSHDELGVAETLDRGDPEELGRFVQGMKAKFGLGVLGGCCGTDVEHLKLIWS